MVGGLERESYFSIQLGISSSQLTFIFFRGVGLYHQPDCHLPMLDVPLLDVRKRTGESRSLARFRP
jgi:hypothetical protein